MGKKLKILVLTATLTCFASSFVSAETIATDTLIQNNTDDKVEQASYSTEDGFRYQVNSDETITITGYQGSETEISIPNEIDGKSVTSISDWAFSDCSSLSKINIPESVTSISGWAFSGCSSLSEINIPESVTSISGWAFSGCSSLSEINVDEKNENYSSENGILCNKGKFQLIRCPEGKTEVTVPENVTSIGGGAFEDCSSLSKINIPEGVTSIGNEAFYGCRSLSEINIPEGVTSIGHETFYCCSSLSKINIPESVTSISGWAFYDCSSLSEINIPEGVTSIGNEAFSGCSNLKEVNIPESVTSIGVDAFSYCSSLSEINIPKSVTSIEDGTFYGCSSLSKINIPESVTSIEDSAFIGCSSLSKINIPESVTSIGVDAFSYCSSLTIYGEESSYAQEYANKNNIPFKLSSEYDKDDTKPDGTVTPPKDDQGDSKPETPITKKYTVKFLNEDGTQIGDVQEIEEGKSAVAPANPTKEGYTFKGWDKDFSNVTSNMEVKAIFEKNAEPGKTDKTEEPNGTATPPKDNQGDNKPTNPNPPKGDDGTNKDTSDVSSMAGIFTMFAGLIGTIGFKRKRK